MQLQDVLTAGHAVQPVHILGDQGKFREALFHLNQGVMSGIWTDRL